LTIRSSVGIQEKNKNNNKKSPPPHDRASVGVCQEQITRKIKKLFLENISKYY
jgi:hypothetical protein